MNANRTKYASTPTYGMQKRGFMKKAPVRQAPETPDFSQVPQPAPTMPPASPQTQQAFAQSVPPQGGFSGMPALFLRPHAGHGAGSLRVAQLHSAHGGSAAFSGLCTGLHRIRATAGQHRIRLLFRGFLAAQSGLCAPFADDLSASCRLSSGRAAGAIPTHSAHGTARYVRLFSHAVRRARSGAAGHARLRRSGGMTPPQTAPFAGMQPPPFAPMQPQAAGGAPQQPMFNLRTPPPQPARERAPFNADPGCGPYFSSGFCRWCLSPACLCPLRWM